MNQLTICLIIFALTLVGFAVGSKYVSIILIALTALSCFSNSSAILMASMFVAADLIGGWLSNIITGLNNNYLAGLLFMTGAGDYTVKDLAKLGWIMTVYPILP